MNSDLKAALELARPLLTQISQLLRPHLPALTEEARAEYPRPRQDFMTAVPVLVQAMETRPELAALVGFDGEEVNAHMSTATDLALILAEIAEIQTCLADGRLVHLADAWRSSLSAYAVAKEMEKHDPSLRQVIAPLALVFRQRRAATTPPAVEE